MTLLQSIFNFDDPIFFAEVLTIITVVIIQLYHSYKVFLNIESLKDIFTKGLQVPEKSTEIISNQEGEPELNFTDTNSKITLVETNGDNEIINRIKNALNNYLINNYGAAVNFSIIKDIIDREVDAKDEEISQSLPIPLYLGLAATMIGIIFGLFSMPSIDGDSFTEGINALINGVKFAMGASLTGLVLTTILSSFFYKKAKKKTLLEKNEQLSYLQAKLLPELIKAEDTGVSGLKASLDRFAREATTIAYSINSAATITGANIKSQLEVLNRVESINVTKVAKANIELFDKLENNMDAFRKFSTYLSKMENISSNLNAFASRTSDVDLIINQINKSTQESTKLTKFLTEHFEKIDDFGGQALKAVNYADSYFREAIEKLSEEVTERIGNIDKSANMHESQLKEIYNKIGSDLSEITSFHINAIQEAQSEHINSFQTVYKEAVPQFNQLNHLENLIPIKDSIDQRMEVLLDGNRGSNKQVEHLQEISRILLKTNSNGSDTSNLVQAINELSIKLTGEEPIPVKKNKTKTFFKNLELTLRIIGWLTIISFGIFFLLIMFEIV